MIKHRSVSKPQELKASLEVFSKQEFNYKRNNSALMSTCLTWDWVDNEQDYVQERCNAQNRSTQLHGRQIQGLNQQYQGKNHQQGSADQLGSQRQPRAQTAPKKPNQQKIKAKQDYSKYEKTQQEIQEQKRKEHDRRQKIQDYIQSMVPYSRTLTNSKFQQFYKKSAPQIYGNGNTTQPVGGIIYGNNLRTFNVNPHDFQNNPKTYQSHTTALNFATRCKRNQEKNWKRLEKELGKKLNLHEKNHTLQQGKQVVYVDVNDQDMYQVMRENMEFKKQHKEQIRDSQKSYEHQKQMKFKAQKQKFYKQKAQKITQNLQATKASNVHNQRQDKNRIGEQVIYKHHDKNGHTRIGADRHALTCFVDIHFPQNDALYTQQFKNRDPIYPTQVQQRHKNLGMKKIQNYNKSLSSVYPSHYLVPCNEQPQIQKMLIQKAKQTQVQTKVKRLN